MLPRFYEQSIAGLVKPHQTELACSTSSPTGVMLRETPKFDALADSPCHQMHQVHGHLRDIVICNADNNALAGLVSVGVWHGDRGDDGV